MPLSSGQPYQGLWDLLQAPLLLISSQGEPYNRRSKKRAERYSKLESPPPRRRRSIDNVTTDMRIYQDEIFGPVLSVVRAPDVATATRMINASERPVILAGIEIHRFGLREEVIRLAERNQIPMCATLLGKSVVSERRSELERELGGRLAQRTTPKCR